jgi:hypothetical protein
MDISRNDALWLSALLTSRARRYCKKRDHAKAANRNHELINGLNQEAEKSAWMAEDILRQIRIESFASQTEGTHE